MAIDICPRAYSVNGAAQLMPRHGRRNRKKPPVEPVRLKTLRLSHDGRGIASVDGKVAFVDGALPGETVVASYLRSHSQYDELIATSIESASPDRVPAVCSFFQVCGGCSLQHLAPAAQVEFKKQSLISQLSHSTGLAVEQIQILDNVVADTVHYRRKARLAVRYVAKKGGVLVGFREKSSSFITDMDNCEVLAKPVAKLIKPLRELIGTLDGRQTIPQVEVAVGETDVQSQLHTALVFRHLEPLTGSDLQQLRNFATDFDCEIYLQPSGPDSIHKLVPSDDPDRLKYYLPDYDLVMAFHPVDFIQVNAGINRKIIPLALRLLELASTDRVLDLFCGLGNFTLPLARHCREVVGVEGSAEMVQRAAENAAANGIDNAHFYTADLCETFEKQDWAAGSFNKILLDPPRSGAIEIIESIASMRASKIVYISCNPATLARDAAKLIECGYTLRRAGVMDMFPHTSHVESIAEFSVCD